VEVTAGEQSVLLEASDFSRPDPSVRQCEAQIRYDSFEPTVTAVLTSISGDVFTHAEFFSLEASAPELTLQNVSINILPSGEQQLVVTAEAYDDTDIQYLGFSVLGIRASDLRAAGGVIKEASSKAFAVQEEYARVTPTVDEQRNFTFVLPIEPQNLLSPAEVSSNGIVLVDLIALDASNNQTSFSTVSFTGDRVDEAVSQLVVDQESVVCTNLLEYVQLVPRVDYQFPSNT